MKHSHDFVENYDGLLGFGLDRETDEKTITCYLQKFSDDELLKVLIKRLTNDELEEIFAMITRMMKNHFSEPEYHQYFLKEED